MTTKPLSRSIPLPPAPDAQWQIVNFPNNLRTWSDVVNPVSVFHALRKSETMRFVLAGLNAAAAARAKWNDGDPRYGTSDVSILNDVDDRSESGDVSWDKFAFKSMKEKSATSILLFKSLAAWGLIGDVSKREEKTRVFGMNSNWQGVYYPYRPSMSPRHFITIARELWSEKPSAHHVVDWPGWQSYFYLSPQNVMQFMYEAHARGEVIFLASGSVLDLSFAAPGMAFSGGREVPRVARSLWDLGDE